MAKKKNNDGLVFDWSDLASTSGAEILEDVESVSAWIDTGILALNYVCSGKFIGGGIPCGKIVEIFGDSASGKSLIGSNILKGVQTLNGIPILLDAERAINKDFAKRASKIDPKRFFVIEADTLESCFNKIYQTTKKLRSKVPLNVPIVIVYDSIAASPSEREFAEVELDMDNVSKAAMKEAGAGADKPGERAKICSKELRKMPAFLKENNLTLIVINQTRLKIGVLYGDPTTPAGGGRALEYYASLRLKIRASKITKDKNDNVLGINVNIRNEKNRCFKPFVEAKSMYLFFEQGINPFGGMLELLIQSGRIKGTTAGNYLVNEPWAGGKEIKFKANKERNDVPVSLLLECPSLVDAENKEQIEYYTGLYQAAIDANNDDVAKEVEVENDKD